MSIYNILDNGIIDFLNDLDMPCFVFFNNEDYIWENKNFRENEFLYNNKSELLKKVKKLISKYEIKEQNFCNDITFEKEKYNIRINFINCNEKKAYLCKLQKKQHISIKPYRNSFSEFSRVYNQNIFSIFNSVEFLKSSIEKNLQNKDIFTELSNNCYCIVKNTANMDLYFKICENRLINSNENIICLQNDLMNIADSSNQILGKNIIDFKSNTNELLYVCIDSENFLPLILNLISNSLNAIGENGAINITLDSDKDNAVIKIKDNGIGIKKDILCDILSDFNSYDTDTNTKSTVGIGLFIVKYIVNMINGSLSITSLENHGSEVIIKIPLTHKNPDSNCTLRSNSIISDMYYNNMSDLHAFLKG